MRLRWKIAGAYAALVLVAAMCVDVSVQRTVREQMVAEIQRDLARDCGMVRMILERAERQEWGDIVRHTAIETGARVTVVDVDGTVLAESDAPPGEMPLHDTRPEIVDARLTGMGWSIRPSRTVGQEMLYVARANAPRGQVVRLAVPLTRIELASARLRRAALLAAVLAAGLGILAAIWLAGGITRDLEDLSETARRIGDGDLSARARLTGSVETARLAGTLNSMAGSLQSAGSRLEQSASRLTSILAQMADGVVVVDVDETVQIMNELATDFLDAGEAGIGRPLAEVALNYEFCDLVRRALQLQTTVKGEVRTAGDDHRHLEVAASPVTNGRGDLVGAVAAVRDITRLKHLEKVRQDFVANAGHELRTPVAAIRSLAEALQGGAMDDPEVSHGFLSRIVSNTERLARLLEDMMELARLEDSETSAQSSSLNVRSLLSSAAGRLGPQADAKRLVVSVVAPEDLEAWAHEDSLMAALVNLVDNAVKYTPEAGRVTLVGRDTDGGVEITVTDTGPGIPLEHRERVFERFYRVDKGRSRDLGGTGLGLSIVRHAVEANDGSVWAESADEGGARFVMRLPGPPQSASTGTE